MVPEDRRLAYDIRHRTLPSFGWITPDLCNDAHDCSIAVSSHYLAWILPHLMRQLGPHGFVVVTFDEGTTDAGCCDDAHGGRVATIFAGPDVRRGVRLARAYTHYSLLRTLEDVFGLAPLHAAAPSPSMRAAFTSMPRLP
jgi:phosphatidylinositol-3-phosphatase